MNTIEQVLIALRRLIRATDLHSKYLMKTAGLTSPQLLILHAIKAKGDVTIGALAKDISISQATATVILDLLEKRGLISRERSIIDKRKVHAHLTDTGVSLLENAPTPLQAHFVSRFGSLPDWEQNMILSSLQRIVEMMDADHIDAAPVLHIGEIDKPVA
ncbi:MAG: MarR family transcriptional regulator [Gammaproteobacteria bacterium]|nr:MarR family transcriptional regulator [Gammaproteobacteria bacterium]